MKSSVFKSKCRTCNKESILSMPFIVVGLHKSKCNICNGPTVLESFFKGEEKSDALYRLIHALFPLFSNYQLMNCFKLTNKLVRKEHTIYELLYFNEKSRTKFYLYILNSNKGIKFHSIRKYDNRIESLHDFPKMTFFKKRKKIKTHIVELLKNEDVQNDSLNKLNIIVKTVMGKFSSFSDNMNIKIDVKTSSYHNKFLLFSYKVSTYWKGLSFDMYFDFHFSENNKNGKLFLQMCDIWSNVIPKKEYVRLIYNYDDSNNKGVFLKEHNYSNFIDGVKKIFSKMDSKTNFKYNFLELKEDAIEDLSLIDNEILKKFNSEIIYALKTKFHKIYKTDNLSDINLKLSENKNIIDDINIKISVLKKDLEKIEKIDDNLYKISFDNLNRLTELWTKRQEELSKDLSVYNKKHSIELNSLLINEIKELSK